MEVFDKDVAIAAKASEFLYEVLEDMSSSNSVFLLNTVRFIDECLVSIVQMSDIL